MSTLRMKGVTAAGLRHLEALRVWQKANGDFRRLPPTSYNRRMTMWVNQCRTDYREGTLSPSTAESLIELGVCMDPIVHGIQPSPGIYDDALKAINLVNPTGLHEDTSQDAPWRSDDFMVDWLARMKAFACRRPSAPLVKDLKRMMPRVFDEHIGPHLADSDQSREGQARRTDDVLDEILKFEEQHQRLPSVFAQSEQERRLASWLMRWEHGLTGRRALSQERQSEQVELMLFLRDALGRADPMVRRSEWHWWSMCVMSTLQTPHVGTRWLSNVFHPSPRAWSKRLKRNPFNDWLGQTSADAVDLKIEEPWRVALAIEENLGHASAQHASMHAAHKRSAKVLGVARHG